MTNRLQWLDSRRAAYVWALIDAPEVRGLLDGIGVGASGEDAAKALEDAIRKAAAMADEARGQELGTRMIRQVREGERKRGDRRTDDWYNRECDDARKVCASCIGSKEIQEGEEAGKAGVGGGGGSLGRQRDQLVRSRRTLWATYRVRRQYK